MRKIFLCLSMLFAGTMLCHTVAGSTDYLSKMKKRGLQQMGMVPNIKAGGNNTFSRGAAFANKETKSVKYALNIPASDSPSATAEGNALGYLTGPDGTQWYYTQDIEYERLGGDNNGGYYYKGYITSSTIRIYNSDSQLMGTIKADVDASLKCNVIEPYGYITSTFFDNDASTYEVAVGMHCVANTDAPLRTQAYTISTGKKIWEKDDQSNGVFTFLGGSGSSYQRLCFLRTGIETVNGEKAAMYYYDVMKPASEGTTGTPTVEHTFKAQSTLLDYLCGVPFYAFEVNGKMNFVVSHYEKPFEDGTADINEDIKVTADNKFIVEAYEYDEATGTYNNVDNLSIPLEAPSGVLYRTAGIGLMSSKDVSYDYYIKGGRAYVIDFNDYVSTDDTGYDSFVVYDTQSNAVKTLCTDICEAMYFELNKLAGFSDQMAFLCLDGSSQGVKIVNIPSGEQETMIPAQIGNDVITINIDRALVGDDYQYVIKLQYGDMGDDGNLNGVIAWYKRDLSLDHKVMFNLGSNGETFMPAIGSETLNPYLFNTDDDYEYVYIAQKDVKGDGVLQYVLEVADAEGNVIRSFTGTDDFPLSDASDIVSFSPSKKKLMVVYTDKTTYKIEFYDLPFNKFANGGDGTEANPYIISTAGDLYQVRNEPNANYKLASDFSMERMGYNWTPITEFSGSLDGDGHTISDFLYKGDAESAGLFGNLASGATVKNLTMTNAQVTSSSYKKASAGSLAGKADNATIDNVHIYASELTASGNSTIAGGIVGSMTIDSKVSSSSFDGNIMATSSAKVGGIAGSVASFSAITATYAKGSATANSTLGGIAGEASDASISDSHADMTLSGGNTVGGVVGLLTGDAMRGKVKRSFAEGSINATSNIGGVVGCMQSGTIAAKGVDVDGCLSAMNITTAETAGNTVNHIVGNAATDESGINNCYALATATINNTASTGTDAASTAGKTIARSDINRSMLSDIGYAYGSDVNSPWTGANGLPSLYFEDKANSVAFNAKTLVVDVAATKEMTVTVYGGSVENLEVYSSDPTVATVEITNISEDENTATVTVTMLAAGSATITASIDGQTATCNVIDSTTGINSAVADGTALTISVDGSNIKANGATSLTVYGVSGQVATSVNDDSVSLNTLSSGIYVVVATDANGNTATAKIVVR